MSISGRLNSITLSISAVAALLIGGLGLYVMRGLISDTERDLASRARSELLWTIAAKAEANEAMAAILARLPAIQQLMRENNRPGLIADLGDAYRQLGSYGITNIHFHRSNITTLVRLHAPNQFDDDLSRLRPMVVEVNQTQKPLRGLELGLNGLPIRGVVPVKNADGIQLGVVEVGSFLNANFLKTFELPGTSYSIFFQQNGKLSLVAESTQNKPASLTERQLLDALTGSRIFERQKHGKYKYVSTAEPLRDYAGQPIGVVQIDVNTDNLEFAFDQNVYFLMLGTIFIMLGAGIVTFYAARVILIRLNRLITVTSDIASGKLPDSIPMQNRVDEFGAFARALERFRTSTSDLMVARDQALAAAVAKSNFLAVMSHELRTPMNAILGFADLLLLSRAQGKSIPERETEYLTDIRRSASHLMELIEDVLQSSALESGHLSITLEQVQLAEELNRTMRLMQQKANLADVTFELKVEQGMVAVPVDRRALRQICLNLISNAIKHTPRGGKVTVGAEIERSSDDRIDQRWICVFVADTGPGIPDEHIDQVTQEFYQVAPVDARTTGGVGLGLSIAKRFAHAHAGELVLLNRPEGGLCVKFRWPVSEPALIGGNKSTLHPTSSAHPT